MARRCMLLRVHAAETRNTALKARVPRDSDSMTVLYYADTMNSGSTLPEMYLTSQQKQQQHHHRQQQQQQQHNPLTTADNTTLHSNHIAEREPNDGDCTHGDEPTTDAKSDWRPKGLSGGFRLLVFGGVLEPQLAAGPPSRVGRRGEWFKGQDHILAWIWQQQPQVFNKHRVQYIDLD